MAAILNSLPPGPGDAYINRTDVERMLASENDAEVALGLILEVVHNPGTVVDSVELEGGGIRETFEGSSAEVIVNLPALGGEVQLNATGSFVVDRGIQYYIPSLTGYGIAVLALLLLATGIYVVYRRRRAVTA
jgi:hypothetical protein